jgi:adenosylhomocysteine nucleosidase
MRVLVTFAVNAEFAPWRKLRRFTSIDYDGLSLWRTSIGKVDVTALLTGMGKQASAQAMGLMMKMADEDKHFDICISSGLAGALQNRLVPGDIIAPKVLIAENQYADLPSDELKVDASLRSMAIDSGAVSADCLLTTDRVLVKAAQKCGCSSRAQSVDMESFEIVKEAHAWGARTVVLRAISDTADEDLPIDFNLTVSKKQRISVTKIMLQLAKNPFVLPALIRFGRQSQKAASRLAQFLDSYVQAIAGAGQENRSREVAAS